MDVSAQSDIPLELGLPRTRIGTRHRERDGLVREVDNIIAMTEPVARNLRITLSYHDLTLGMADLIGTRDVSWVGFATWASRTAGRFIRNDYMPNIVNAYMEKLAFFHRGVHFAHNLLTGVRRRHSPPPRSLLEETVERVSDIITDHIGTGNNSLFTDVGPVFASMIERFRGATMPNRKEFEGFLSTLRPGPVDRDGQDLLIEAFGYFYEAMFETDRKRKSELILLANNLVGFHEQSRLQQHIFHSLNAPVASLIADAAHQRAHQLTHSSMHAPVDGMIDRMLRPFYKWLQIEWASVATRWLMRIELPTMTLSLGEDLPNRCEHYMFPKDLMVIEHPALCALLERMDYTPDTVEGSAATNWGSLEDRMNFIVDFFRTRQQDESLIGAPFTDEQIPLIRRNEIPEGEL